MSPAEEIKVLEERLEKAIAERKYLAYLLAQWKSRRLDSHANRLRFVVELVCQWSAPAKPLDLYSTTSDQLRGEDYLLFNCPEVWLDYRWSEAMGAVVSA